MQINDRMEQLHNAVSQTYIAVEPDGPGNCGKQERGRSREIVCEHFLDVYVDEQLTFRLTCTATHLPELILGRLFTEGWIESVRDVESITICESGRSARVFLQENLRGSDRQIATDREASCCIGNLTFLEKNGKRQLRELPGTEWQNAWIFALAEEFAGDCELHRQTGGTHSCYLGVRDKCVCRMEDIGRHNALDKCIGYALLKQLELSECILFTTGRVPTDMVQKVIAPSSSNTSGSRSFFPTDTPPVVITISAVFRHCCIFSFNNSLSSPQISVKGTCIPCLSMEARSI